MLYMIRYPPSLWVDYLIRESLDYLGSLSPLLVDYLLDYLIPKILLDQVFYCIIT